MHSFFLARNEYGEVRMNDVLITSRFVHKGEPTISEKVKTDRPINVIKNWWLEGKCLKVDWEKVKDVQRRTSQTNTTIDFTIEKVSVRAESRPMIY